MPRRHNKATIEKLKETISHEPLPDEDMQNLADTIKTSFGWEHSPRPFQLEAIQSQLQRKDVLVHAGTGYGKTAIAAGPHTHPKMKGRITVMISPLIGLQEEQARTFTNEFRLTAIAINSSHGGITKKNMKRICEGAYQIVIISPELLLSKPFIENVIRDWEFALRIFSVVVDEAHVISYWGPLFRKMYGRLGILRALLPKHTVFVALSATLSPRIRKSVLDTLRFPAEEDKFLSINIGNDRPNISLVARAIEHPMNSYVDLDFLIPPGAQSPTDIPRTFIYADNLAVGAEIESHLEELLPAPLRGKGIIRPFNAALSQDYRDKALEVFREGTVLRIMICTDACGMGCNIPGIEFVVQWKLASSLSSFIQRIGRAARGPDSVGIGVILVEKSAYDLIIEEFIEDEVRERRKGKGKQAKPKKKKKKDNYAVLHGVRRGAHDAKPEHDAILLHAQPKLDPNAKDEGMLVFVQTGLCRRGVQTQVYLNVVATPTVLCCDNCAPELLDRTRPGVYTSSRMKKIKQGLPCTTVVVCLLEWRTLIHERDFADSLFGPSGFLKDETVVLLSSVGPIKTKDQLARILSGRWLWYTTYSDELFELLNELGIPPMIPKPRSAKPRGEKRRNDDEEEAPNAARENVVKARKSVPAGGKSKSAGSNSHAEANAGLLMMQPTLAPVSSQSSSMLQQRAVPMTANTVTSAPTGHPGWQPLPMAALSAASTHAAPAPAPAHNQWTQAAAAFRRPSYPSTSASSSQSLAQIPQQYGASFHPGHYYGYSAGSTYPYLPFNAFNPMVPLSATPSEEVEFHHVEFEADGTEKKPPKKARRGR